jgi:RNA polymerase sigma factor (sigma-70 family)
MQQPDHPESGEALFLQQRTLIDSIVRAVCARNYLDTSDAEDFASIVAMKIIDDDYAVLRKFEGRSKLKTFLTSVVQHQFQDYRNKEWGKWRPSAEAKRAGPLALLLERLIVRDGHTFEEACELLKAKHRVSADRADLERLVAVLPARVRRRFEPDNALAYVAASGIPADESVAMAERQPAVDRVAAVMNALLAKMDTQDRLLLVWHYRDGRSVTDIAKIWRLDQKALYRRREKVLADLRRGIEHEGIEAGVVVEALTSGAIQFEWDDPDQDGTGRESVMKGEEWR